MRIIQPSFQIEEYTPNMTKLIERAIRTCYRSEDRIEEGSDVKIIELIKSKKHESTLEHGVITVRFVCDRGVTHELVRHRIASFSQESTRYCSYDRAKHGSEITVIEPFFWSKEKYGITTEYSLWKSLCEDSEKAYMKLLEAGATAQEARSVLPNSLKTEIVVTANVREWRKIFELRTSNAAHPQIRQIMCPTLTEFRKLWPILFDDVGCDLHECPAIQISNNELSDVEELFTNSIDCIKSIQAESVRSVLLNESNND